MVLFTVVIISAAVLLNIGNIHAVPVSHDSLDIQCRAQSHDEVRCHWQNPSFLGESGTNCSFFFMITPGHPHDTRCIAYSNWTLCEPEDDGSCYFPAYPEDFSMSVFGACGPDVDVKVECTDGHSSDVLTVNIYNITMPEPVTNLNAFGSGVSEVTVNWDKPPLWEDDFGLIFVIEYWQEHSDDIHQITQEENIMKNVYTEIIHDNLPYADTVTCVRVASYFSLNPLKTLSDWSNDSCTKTFMDAPQDKPDNIQVHNLSVDWEKQTRGVNLTWDPIPVHLQGGPILGYTVQICQVTSNSECTARNVSNQTHLYLELDPLSSYKINIRAHNEVGQSSFKEHTIIGLTPPERSKLPYYLGIMVSCIIVVVVLISSLLVLRKKMKASHLPPIELHEKSLAVVIKPVHKEEEIFDSLKPRGQVSAIDERGTDSPRYLERMRDSTTPLLSKNGHVLQKLELNGEHMPLVEDADLYGGEVSPTDSGLQCDDFLMDSQGEPSPIPMSFLPTTNPSRKIDLDNLTPEQAHMPPDRRDDLSGVSVGSSPSDSGQSGEGYVVQALAASEDGATGDNTTGESAYNDGSVISSIGYVQMATPDTEPGREGHNSPYVPQGPIVNNGSYTAESSIPSYVQQDAAEISQDGKLNDSSTSGTSSCPSYVKQSEG